MIEPSPTNSASSPLITSGRGVGGGGGGSPEVHHYLLRLGDGEKEVVVIAPAHKLLHGTAVRVFTRCDEAGQRRVVRELYLKCVFGSTQAVGCVHRELDVNDQN